MGEPEKCIEQPWDSYHHKFKELLLYGKRGFDPRMQVAECRGCGLKVYRAPRPRPGRLKRRRK